MQTHQKSSGPVATIGLDIDRNSFHHVDLDKCGAIAMRIKVSRNELMVDLLSSLPASSAWRPALALSYRAAD